jgi:hypothetical protein
MLSWFADNIAGFVVSLVRILLRKLRARRCTGWRETTATIVGVNWQAQSYFPRPDAEIVYTYRIDGGFYGGVDTKPFCLESSAKNYATRFAKGDNLVIRVKPGNPETSIVLDSDQIKIQEPAASSRISP